MSDVHIRRSGTSPSHLPVLEELAARMQAVREKAFELFTRRGEGTGRELDDWIAAEREVLGWPTAKFTATDGAYEVDVSLAGFTDKDVEVTATPGELIVHAATSEERKGGDEQVMWSEFGSRDVYRRFAFPKPVNADKVTASLDHGILRIRAPVMDEGKVIAPDVEERPTALADAPSRAPAASSAASTNAPSRK